VHVHQFFYQKILLSIIYAKVKGQVRGGRFEGTGDSDYLGKMMLSGNEVAYLFKNMDEVISLFQECVKGDEQLDGNVLCQ